MIINFSVG